MPTFDGGHCFLTALLPISVGEIVDAGGMLSSPVHMVRELLSVLPTARQSPATLHADSPFARNDKTHFARFAIIDDVVFNGRVPGDAILSRSDPSVPQPVDRLNCPYLMFAVEFDAPGGTEAELQAYLREIWTQMQRDLEPVFRQCHGFAATDADGFAAYVMRCQIETTMPFNDYWAGAPPLPPRSLRKVALMMVAAFLVLWIGLYLLCDVAGLLARAGPLAAGLWPWLAPCVRGIELLILPFLAAAIVVFTAYRLLRTQAAKPFPTAPGASLPAVLKALYLQRAFTSFAIAAAQLDGAELRVAFGAFLAEHRPEEIAAPTQDRGAIPLTDAMR